MAKIKETCTLYKLLAVLGLAKTAEMTKDFELRGISINAINNVIIPVRNDREVEYLLNHAERSVMLVSNPEVNTQIKCYSPYGKDNLIIESKDIWSIYKKIVDTYRYVSIISDFKPDDYGDIMNKCAILSKTSKLFNCKVGKKCSFHHGVLIGCDDLQVTKNAAGDLISIPQLGYTKIGDETQILNNSVVYRGAFDVTELGNHVQVGTGTVIEADCTIEDNVYIGNNCVIGRGTFICAGTVIKSGTILEPETSIESDE